MTDPGYDPDHSLDDEPPPEDGDGDGDESSTLDEPRDDDEGEDGVTGTIPDA